MYFHGGFLRVSLMLLLFWWYVGGGFGVRFERWLGFESARWVSGCEMGMVRGGCGWEKVHDGVGRDDSRVACSSCELVLMGLVFEMSIESPVEKKSKSHGCLESVLCV